MSYVSSTKRMRNMGNREVILNLRVTVINRKMFVIYFKKR